ncbi:hypothetical protein [Streptomyces winkii]|uniref:hypothetical protein n=1 Tax=Streptomyces winkii TaxID=3051178 RepID=UPI0028D4B193|nr:hypothetical protein [Streptomyces sp. DSM 40971]
MSELLPAAGLAGAVLCLAGHLPGPVHRWGPQLLAMGGMALMAGGKVSPGTCAAGAACLWSVVRACAARRGWTRSVDLAAMTLLMTLMSGDITSGGSHTHTAAAAGDPAGAAAVLTVIVWVTARAGGIMFRRLSGTSSTAEAIASPVRRARAYRESGAVLMIVSMAAMLV